MKFDHTDWKILSFKVGKESLFEYWSAISDDFDSHLCKNLALWTLNYKRIMLKNLVESLGFFLNA